ncbi:hypothetical protein, partial [Caballeronia sordidicola]
WVGSNADWTDYPIDAAMNACFAAGDNGWIFFHSAGGWTLPQPYSGTYGSNCLNVTISNQTYNALNTELTMIEGFAPAATSQMVPSYMSGSLQGAYDGGLSMQIDIFDPSISSDNPVASFIAHQHDSITEGADCWIDTTSQNSGYTMLSPICNSGSPFFYSGAIQVTLFYNSN